MGTLGMVGTTFRRAGQLGLAYYTLTADEIKKLHEALGCLETVYLATCNRVEAYFVAPLGTEVATVRARFFQHFAGLRAQQAPPFADARGLMAYGEDGAAERLFVVACALDSMVPGEAQILGQVKSAYQAARQAGHCGPLLANLFAQAFAVAKRVREDTTLGRGKTSMVSLAVDLLGQRLALQGPGAALAVVGTGAMAEQCLRHFAGTPVQLYVVNRTPANARDLAQRYGAKVVALGDFVAAPPPFAAMLTSTASPVPLFDAAFFHRLLLPGAEAPVVVDLSVQRDVVPLEGDAAQMADLWDIDRLKGRASVHHQARRDQLALGRQLVDDALEHFHRQQTERSLSHALRDWRGHNAQLVRQSLPSLDQRLASLVQRPEQRGDGARLAALEAWAAKLLAGLMHGPTHGLKALAQHYGEDAVQTFVDGARLPPPQAAAEEKL